MDSVGVELTVCGIGNGFLIFILGINTLRYHKIVLNLKYVQIIFSFNNFLFHAQIFKNLLHDVLQSTGMKGSMGQI